MCVFIVLNLESTLCQVVQLLKVFKLWCEGGISLDTGTKLYLESTEVGLRSLELRKVNGRALKTVIKMHLLGS